MWYYVTNVMVNGGNHMLIMKNHLAIRSAVEEDAEVLTNWWNDGSVMAHAGFPNGLGQSIDQTRDQIQRNEANLSQRCIIEVDGIFVGEMNFQLIGEGIAEIGIKICNTEYQNKGYGSVIIRMLLQYLFEDQEPNSKYEVEKVILDTNLKNVRAQHVYEKVGFSRVRVNHHTWQDQLGEWQDSVDYEMSKELYINTVMR